MNEKTISGAYVAETTEELSSLTIAPGAEISAPAGKNVTLTVDGKETAILPGSYTGKIVMTVA